MVDDVNLDTHDVGSVFSCEILNTFLGGVKKSTSLTFKSDLVITKKCT